MMMAVSRGRNFYATWLESFKAHLFSFNSVLVRNKIYLSAGSTDDVEIPAYYHPCMLYGQAWTKFAVEAFSRQKEVRKKSKL